MKKNNKGFSLVELIIVIAIMAILAGALAPALIKYINKSRRSADISNADTLRTAVQTAMSDEDGMAQLMIKAGTTGKLQNQTVSQLEAITTYGDELKSILGNKAQLKSKYFAKNSEFTVDIDIDNNSVVVKAGSKQVSPDPDASASNGNNNQQSGN